MAPIDESLNTRWPEAHRFHILEEGLSADRLQPPAGAAPLADRFVALSRYAQLAGADGILYTCSAFGAEIEAARSAVALPTLKPNEAMLEDALVIGRRVGLVATFAPSLDSISDELHAAAKVRGVSVTIETVLAANAMSALARGDAASHDEEIAVAARRLPTVDVVLLAQFSMARALASVTAAVRVPVLTSPDSAVDALRRTMTTSPTSRPVSATDPTP